MTRGIISRISTSAWLSACFLFCLFLSRVPAGALPLANGILEPRHLERIDAYVEAIKQGFLEPGDVLANMKNCHRYTGIERQLKHEFLSQVLADDSLHADLKFDTLNLFKADFSLSSDHLDAIKSFGLAVDRKSVV